MKKLLFILLLIPFFGVAQNNIAIKGMMSLNTTDTAAIQNYRASLQALYGNTGGLYHDKTRNKWRVWMGVCADTSYHNGCWVDLLSNGGTSVSGVQFANNGLSLSGDTVQVGGILTKDTEIGVGNKIFNITSVGGLYPSANSSIYIEPAYTELLSVHGNRYGDIYNDYGVSSQTVLNTVGGVIKLQSNKTTEIHSIDRLTIDSIGNILLPHTKTINLTSESAGQGIKWTSSSVFTKELLAVYSNNSTDTTIRIYSNAETSSLIPNMSLSTAITVGTHALPFQTNKSTFAKGELIAGNAANGLSIYDPGNTVISMNLFYDNSLSNFGLIGSNKTLSGRQYAPYDDSYINFDLLGHKTDFAFNDSSIFHIDHTNFYLDKIVTTPDNSQTNILTRNASTGKIQLRDASSLSGTPAGSNTQIQFNNSGVFGATSDLVWDGTFFKVGGTTGIYTFSGGITNFNAGGVFGIGQTDNSTGNGGQTNLSAGNSTGANGNGGDLFLNAGSKNGSGLNGNIYLAPSGAGSSVFIGSASISGNKLLTVKFSTTDAGVTFSTTQGSGTGAINGNILNVTGTNGLNLTSSDIVIDGNIQLGNGSTVTIGMYGVTKVVRGAVGTTLVNNVTVGGTTGTIADFTSLTVYATDAATIRNDIYQLALKVATLEAKLKLLGAVKD